MNQSFCLRENKPKSQKKKKNKNLERWAKEEREVRREEEEEEEFHPEPLTTSIVFVLSERVSRLGARAARESGYAWVMHVSLSLSTGSSRVESSVWDVCGFSGMRTLNSTLHLRLFSGWRRADPKVISWLYATIGHSVLHRNKKENKLGAHPHSTKAWSDRGESVTTGEAFASSLYLAPPDLRQRGEKERKGGHAHADYGVFSCGGHGVPGISRTAGRPMLYSLYI